MEEKVNELKDNEEYGIITINVSNVYIDKDVNYIELNDEIYAFYEIIEKNKELIKDIITHTQFEINDMVFPIPKIGFNPTGKIEFQEKSFASFLNSITFIENSCKIILSTL